jgi:hypothetical protein
MQMNAIALNPICLDCATKGKEEVIWLLGEKLGNGNAQQL